MVLDCKTASFLHWQLTLSLGFRQYMWCPLSHLSHSSICSASPLRLQILQRAWRADFCQMMLFSRVERWRNTCARLEQNRTDSSQRSLVVFSGTTSSCLLSSSVNIQFCHVKLQTLDHIFLICSAYNKSTILEHCALLKFS